MSEHSSSTSSSSRRNNQRLVDAMAVVESIRNFDLQDRQEAVNSTRSMFRSSPAQQVAIDHVQDKILAQEEVIDRLDQQSLRIEIMVRARLDLKSSLGAALSLKQYLQVRAKREVALDKMEQLECLLAQLEQDGANDQVPHLLLDGNYKAEVEKILAQRTTRLQPEVQQGAEEEELLVLAYATCFGSSKISSQEEPYAPPTKHDCEQIPVCSSKPPQGGGRPAILPPIRLLQQHHRHR